MRKALFIALGLASLGAFTQRATAEAIDCARQYDMCILDTPSPGDLTVRGCEYTLQQCTNKNAKLGRNIYGLGDGYCPKVTNGTASRKSAITRTAVSATLRLWSRRALAAAANQSLAHTGPSTAAPSW